jgi:hypothetical protein
MLTTGCEPKAGGTGRHAEEPGLDDQPVDVVIGRVNDNAQRMNFLLRGRSVSARGRWDGEAFDLTGGTLLYRKPRDLYLKLEHTLGKAIEIGSNSHEFWVWKRLGEDRYWWGMYSQMDNVNDAEIPILPEHLLEVIGLQSLPDQPGQQPLFWVGTQRYELIYSARDSEGRPYLSRTVDIDRREPFLIREVVFFHPDGHPIITAKLSEYGQVPGTAVTAPHHVEMRWLDQDSWLQMQIGKMDNAGEGGLLATKFVSPLSQGRHVGKVERVDRPASPAPEPAKAPSGSTATDRH